MPIPSFTIDGILPPYVGANGPGGRAEDMSPYFVTALEVVSSLGGTDNSRTILNHWLRHRAELRALGFQRGFQWLDGSFVEEKEPNDLDVVTFIRRPSATADLTGLTTLIKSQSQSGKLIIDYKAF